MAGVQAGRISIEIVAEIARLQQDLDKAKRAVKAASGDIAKSAKAANDNLAGMGRGIAGAGTSSRLASHHVQNLAFQFQDLAVGLASGQRPMTVFMQQGTQIGAIMGQAGIGVGGLAKQVGLMVANFARAHPILLGISAAVGVAAAGFKMFAAEVDKTGELDRYAKSLGLTKKEMEDLGPTTVTAGDALQGLWRTIDEGLGLSDVFSSIADWAVEAFQTVLEWGQKAAAGIYAGFVGTYNGIKAVWPMLPEVIGEAAVGAANAAIAAIEGLINDSIQGLNALVAGVNTVLGTSLSGLEMVDFGRIENQFAGAGREAAGAFASAYQEAYGEAQSAFDSFGERLSDNIVQSAKDRLAAKAGEIIDDRAEKSVGDRAKKVGKTAAEKLFEQLTKDAQSYISNLEDTIAKFGKSALEIHRLEVAAKAAAAPTKELTDRIRQLGSELEALMVGEANTEMEKRLQSLRDELSLLGLVGDQRELAALVLEKEAFFADAAAKGVSDVNAKWEEYLHLRTAIIEGESALETQAEGLRIYNDQLRETIGLLQGLGGLGDILGGLLGVVSGNIGGVRGTLGSLLNLDTGQRRRDEKTGEVIAVRLGDQLREIFGLSGEFGKMLTAALQNAGIGMAAANMVGARGTGGQVGGAVGGIVGGIAGEAFKGALTSVASKAFGSALGSALGSAVPVVGTILGGILGGLAGNLLGSVMGGRSAGAIVTGKGVNNFGGSKSNYGAANNLAGSVTDSLAKMADALGATVGDFKVTIGMFKDEIRVNASGSDTLKGSGVRSFGQDAAAAVQYALADAIKDGALTGLRAGTAALLKKGGDLETQLQKAVAFESVFKSLEEAADPAAAALKQLDAEFAELTAIFNEAGASADERAKLEELYEREKAKITAQGAQIDQVAVKRREMEIALMTAQGHYMEALAAARADELAQLDPSLRALQEQVWAADLLNEKRLLEIQLMEAQGNVAGALAAQRELELEATHESLRSIKEQIWAFEDAKEAARAANELREAWASVGSSIMDEVRRIRGLDGAAGGSDFVKLMAQFNATTAAARSGDMEAAKNLPNLSQDLLRAAELAATSRQEVDRVRAQTAASLEATNAAIASLSASDAALLSAAASQEASNVAANDSAATALAETNQALKDELAALRTEMKAGLAAVASNTGRVAKKMDDVTAASGGDAISTVAA